MNTKIHAIHFDISEQLETYAIKNMVSVKKVLFKGMLLNVS